MSDCKIYPADTVDIYGNVWPSVGENIRNGIFGENVKVGYVNINKGAVIIQGNADEKVLNESNQKLTYNILNELKRLKSK